MTAIAFIGAGKVGLEMGRFLKGKGFLLSGYYSKTPSSSIKCAGLTGSEHFESVGALTAAAPDIIFITTPDDVIKSVAEKLFIAGYSGIVCHTSGALTSEEALYMFDRRASMHPPYSFAGETAHSLYDIAFAVEGCNDFIDILKENGIKYFSIAPEDKPKYHLAACILSNFLVSLASIGYNILESISIPPHVFDTLLRNTLDNIIKLGAHNALTGPLKRGDIDTIKKHMSILRESPYMEIYKNMSKNLLSITDLNDDTKDEIIKIIK